MDLNGQLKSRASVEGRTGLYKDVIGCIHARHTATHSGASLELADCLQRGIASVSNTMKTVDRLLVLRDSVLDRMTEAALPMQFLAYLLIGGVCALINLLLFSIFFRLTFTWVAAAVAFVAAGAINYWLCVSFLFKRNHLSTWRELTAYAGLVVAVANIDAFSTLSFIGIGVRPTAAKLSATVISFVFNFLGRRFLIFSQSSKSGRALENS